MFPIGRRLAFDAARGRLWAVCRICGRWNLSPLEERWEAIEECERAYRGTRLRFASDNIGLARVAEGLDLVRVGNPLRPEIAAWRYSIEFRRRARKGIAVGALISIAGPLAPLIALPGWINSQLMRRKVVAFVRDELSVHCVRGKHALRACILPAAATVSGSEWSLLVRHDEGSAHLYNAEATRVASIALARLNWSGAFRRHVNKAVSLLDAVGDAHGMFRRIAKNVSSVPDLRDYELEKLASAAATMSSLFHHERLALEMAAHDEMERVAFEGELQMLEQAWRDAEAIARIADSLLVPAHIEEWMRRETASPSVTDSARPR
jgi:hypothetical protein